MKSSSSSAALGRHTIGLVSDTHGLLRPDVHDALAGVERIFHAGDVGGPGGENAEDILRELGLIAPVFAVFGNTDPVSLSQLSPAIEATIGGLRIHVSHGHELGSPNPAKLLAKYSADVIVYGHTHRQLITYVDNRLVINPGSAGQSRFSLGPSVARLTIQAGKAHAEIIELKS